MKQNNYDTSSIDYSKVGSDERRVLILHGWGGSKNSLDVISRPLSRYCEVWSISFPGFGDSPEPKEVWGVEEYVECLLEWLSARGLKDLDILAHSFGGRIAIRLAATHPEYVRRLVLIDSAGLIPRRSLRTRIRIKYARLLTKFANMLGGKIAEELNRKKQKLGSEDWRSASPMMKRILSRVVNEDQTGDLGKITNPTLLIWGKEDRDTPVYMAEKMRNEIPDSRLKILPDAGHYSFLDRKGDVLTLIWKHLGLPSAW